MVYHAQGMKSRKLIIGLFIVAVVSVSAAQSLLSNRSVTSGLSAYVWTTSDSGSTGNFVQCWFDDGACDCFSMWIEYNPSGTTCASGMQEAGFADQGNCQAHAQAECEISNSVEPDIECFGCNDCYAPWFTTEAICLETGDYTSSLDCVSACANTSDTSDSGNGNGGGGSGGFCNGDPCCECLQAGGNVISCGESGACNVIGGGNQGGGNQGGDNQSGESDQDGGSQPSQNMPSNVVAVFSSYQIEEGVTGTFSPGSSVGFSVAGEEHFLEATQIMEDSVIFTFYSDPRPLKLKIGQTELIDANNDGKPDMQVTLNDIKNGKPDVTIKSIPEEEEALQLSSGQEDEGCFVVRIFKSFVDKIMSLFR